MEQSPTRVTVEALVNAPIETVWEYWTNPEHVKQWNAASPDWHSPSATNDLRVGGEFHYRMEAKDQSAGFDFNGTYTEVAEPARIAYTIEGGRQVEVTFEQMGEGTKVTETFDVEHENPVEMQRGGWQSIMDNFKQYVESSV